ncbi:MAG: NDP-sugar synthase [Deltaproteobacteria bacterium]|nr:NDP-sugar synthase [Deltaproteobacteria bacterium]
MTVAWILAAGLGTRLRPLSAERPKPLLEVCGRPLIVHTLQLLKDAGVVDVAVNSHWLHPQIPAALGKEVDVDGTIVTLRYTHEPTALGTGGGLLGLRHVLPSKDRALIANADALIDLDVRGLLASSAGPLSTLVLKAVPDVAAYGAIGTDDDDRVVSFAKRITPRGRVARERMFCGWHYLHPHALDLLPQVAVDDAGTVTGPESCINKEGYPHWLSEGAPVHGFDHAGFFFDVGTPERLWEANRLMLSGDVQFAHLKPFARFTETAGRVFQHRRAQVFRSVEITGPVVIDDGAVIEAGARIGPYAVIGPGVRVKSSVQVTRSVVQSNVVVDVDAVSVHVSPGCRVPIA